MQTRLPAFASDYLRQHEHPIVVADLSLVPRNKGTPRLLDEVFEPQAERLVSRASLEREVVRVHVLRFDGATADGQFSGTAKGWANTEPSVPARAVQQSRTANPVVLIDEIDKCRDSHNGFLAHALLGFLDPESAGRYRDQSLDAELNLSMLSYIATANDVTGLPSPLRDRFRIVRVPAPSIEHLPSLAASVMRDLAAEDEARWGDDPLAGDELDVIGKAWVRTKFSMRSLQKIVRATLDARDQHAMRH